MIRRDSATEHIIAYNVDPPSDRALGSPFTSRINAAIDRFRRSANEEVTAYILREEERRSKLMENER